MTPLNHILIAHEDTVPNPANKEQTTRIRNEDREVWSAPSVASDNWEAKPPNDRTKKIPAAREHIRGP